MSQTALWKPLPASLSSEPSVSARIYRHEPPCPARRQSFHLSVESVAEPESVLTCAWLTLVMCWALCVCPPSAVVPPHALYMPSPALFSLEQLRGPSDCRISLCLTLTSYGRVIRGNRKHKTLTQSHWSAVMTLVSQLGSLLPIDFSQGYSQTLRKIKSGLQPRDH